jgi:hypothetical protein
MSRTDSTSRDRKVMVGRCATMAILAVLFWLGAEPLLGLDSMLNSQFHAWASDRSGDKVVLVRIPSTAGNLWKDPRLPEVLQALGEAAAVIPADAPPKPVLREDVARIASLVATERRTNASDQQRISRLERQLADLQSRLAHQDAVTAAMLRSGNVVMNLRLAPGQDARPTNSTSDRPCRIDWNRIACA